MSEPQATEKAFVAGATGYTGRAVVEALRRLDILTVAHVRPQSRQRQTWEERFGAMGAEVDTTPWERDAIIATVERLRPTLVFALLGTTKKRAKQDQASYDSVDYRLTAMLIAACEPLSPPPRFIYLSSAGVPAAEPRKGSYMHARWHVERDLEASSLPYVSARPSFITGANRDEDRPGERVGAAVANGALSMLGAIGMKRLRDRYRSTDNTTLAAGLVRLARDVSRSRYVAESEELR